MEKDTPGKKMLSALIQWGQCSSPLPSLQADASRRLAPITIKQALAQGHLGQLYTVMCRVMCGVMCVQPAGKLEPFGRTHHEEGAT